MKRGLIVFILQKTNGSIKAHYCLRVKKIKTLFTTRIKLKNIKIKPMIYKNKVEYKKSHNFGTIKP